MSSDYCGLSPSQIEEVKERHRHFVPIRVDERTIIFIDHDRDAEEAKKKFIKELKHWRTKHYNDE